MYLPGFGFGKDGTAILVGIIVVYVGVSVVKGYFSALKKRKNNREKFKDLNLLAEKMAKEWDKE